MIIKRSDIIKHDRLKYIMLLYSFCFLYSIEVYSQEIDVDGHVYYTIDSTGLAGVNVLLYKNGVFEYGNYTDKNGQFHINQVPLGQYELRLNFIGMKEKVINQIKIDSTSHNMVFYYPEPCKTGIKECPYGHSDKLIRIVYGLPTKRAMRKAKRGKIRLGGCIVSDCDPQWYCKKHNIEF